MFLGGVFLPRFLLPDLADPDRRLHAAGRAGPAGRLARHAARRSLPLAMMAVITVVAGAAGGPRCSAGSEAGVKLAIRRSERGDLSVDAGRLGAAWRGRWTPRAAYVLLALPTVFGARSGRTSPPDWRLITARRSSRVTAAWVLRHATPASPRPRQRQPVRMLGLLRRAAGARRAADAAQPDLLHLRDHRLLPRVRSCGRGRWRSSASSPTSILDQHADRPGFPWPTLELLDPVRRGDRRSRRSRSGSARARREGSASRTRSAGRPLAGSRRRWRRTRAARASCSPQAREAGVLDERQRMAREIHDTIAQGLTGIVTQLQAAEQARDRPADRDRHVDNARALARESLRGPPLGRGVAARGAEAASLPDALRRPGAALVRRSTASTVDVTTTGDAVAAPPRDRGRAAAGGAGGAGQRGQSTPARPASG